MPRYYFDVLNGGLVIDDEGIEFSDPAQARAEALRSLPDLAKSFIESEDGRRVSITVRDAAGRSIYEATLTITARWPTDAT